MCENLIFSGIDEQIVEAENGKLYENSEPVPRNFLRDEVDILCLSHLIECVDLVPTETLKRNPDPFCKIWALKRRRQINWKENASG